MEEKPFEKLQNKDVPISEKQYMFEKYILHHFLKEFKLKKETIFTDYVVKTTDHSSLKFDAILPKDWKMLKGPILLEMRKNINKNIFSKIARNVNSLPKNEIKTFLLILNVDSISIDKLIYRKLWNDLTDGEIELAIWDLPEVERNLNFSRNQIEYIQKISFAKIEKDLIENTTEKQTNTSNAEALRGLIKSNECVLFLGSGVSKEYELPLWNELINGLSEDVVNNLEFSTGKEDNQLNYLEKILLKKELNELLGSNTLLAANYLESGISNPEAEPGEPKYRKEFNRRLRRVLYENYKEPSNYDSQLKEIAKKIISSENNIGVTKVITYNYDDLLQKEIHKLQPDFQIETIFEGTASQTKNFPIYHVHGFLPEEESKYKGYKIEEQEIVFTEKSYFDLQKLNNESERNRVQSNALKNNIVIMVGLSLNDPNLRRLLLETKNGTEVTAYVLLHSHSIEKSTYLKDLENHVGERFLNRHHQILRQNLLKLGVDVVWYKNHEDVVGILNEIFS